MMLGTKKEHTESQRSYILRALIGGQRITALSMVKRIFCLRTSPRITELKRKGYRITTVLLRGDNCNYAEYYMTPAQRAHAKKMGGGK